MAATRREFLSMSLIAGAGLALPGKAFAQSVSPEAAEAGAGASTALDSASTVFTRGIGMYPGAPSENFQPELLLDADAPYRNLALLRPAYASSSYDYNLTAQLVTDGLVDTVLPQWITTVVDGQILPKMGKSCPRRSVKSWSTIFSRPCLSCPAAILLWSCTWGAGLCRPLWIGWSSSWSCPVMWCQTL
jgi:hypothetical protein